MTTGDFYELRELFITLRAFANIARIDTQFRQGGGTFGMLTQQLVAVEMKIPDQRNVAI